MKDSLKLGITHSAELLVTAGHTVPGVTPPFAIFADMPPVLASAFMIGFIEATCIECIKDHLEDEEHSLGIYFDLNHTAPTPVGRRVTVDVELVEMTGRKLEFRVEAKDEAGKIGGGIHKRAVIDLQRFMDRLGMSGG